MPWWRYVADEMKVLVNVREVTNDDMFGTG